MLKSQDILTAIVAGIAACLVTMAVARGGLAAQPLLIIAPVPIYIVALAWGTFPGFIAAAVCTLAIALFNTPMSGMLAGVMMAFPAAWIGHLAGLSRTIDERSGELEWYPVGAIFNRLTLAVAAGCVIAAFTGLFDPGPIEDAYRQIFTEMRDAGGGTGAQSDEEIANLARMIGALVPFLFPIIWLLAQSLALMIAWLVVGFSGHLKRPRDDLALELTLPSSTLPIFAVALAVALFVDGIGGQVGKTITGALFVAYTMSGFAALHLATRGRATRGLILFASYFICLMFTLPLIAFAIAGIARSYTTRGTRKPTINNE